MAAGFSRVRIFNKMGIELAELGVATTRSWTLDSVGRCNFTVPIYSSSGGFNPQATEDILNYGNLILVEHKPSVNADGTTNGVLPNWVGILAAPRQWSYGQIQCTAYSAEQILNFRASPKPFTASGTPGAVFKQLILWANDPSFNPGAYPIQLGTIELAGANVSRDVKGSILDEVSGVIKDFGGDWDITPYVTANNQLLLVANYYQLKGAVVNQTFHNQNVEYTSPLYVEQGDFFNWVRGYSSTASTGNVNFAATADQASIAKHGLFGANTVYQSISGQYSAAGFEAVQAANQNFLNQNRFPTRTVAPNVLDVGNAFSFLNVGNYWYIYLDTVGFTNGQIGLAGAVRITAMEYTELTNSVRVAGLLQ